MEGHLTMSKKERARLVVMAKVMKSEVKISEPYDGCEASELLGLSYRQTFRIAKRYGAEGAVGLVHRSCGRASNRAWDEEEKRKILERYSERYAGYGPTFTVEKLGGDGYGVDHETLRRWLIREGLSASKFWGRTRRRRKPCDGYGTCRTIEWSASRSPGQGISVSGHERPQPG